MGGKREIPKADAAASRHINQLAVLRKQVAALQKVAKRHVAALQVAYDMACEEVRS